MSVEKLQLMAIKEQSLQAYNATDKLLSNINVLSTMLKKVDVTNITCISNTLVQSKDTVKEATKNTSGFALAIEKIGQKMPNIKTVIDGIAKKIPDVKKAMEDIYKATESHIFTQFTTKV